MSEVKNETIEKMVKQRARMDARIQLLKNKQTAQNSKIEICCKILAGEYFIKLMGGDMAKVGARLLEANFVDEKGAAVFSRFEKK